MITESYDYCKLSNRIKLVIIYRTNSKENAVFYSYIFNHYFITNFTLKLKIEWCNNDT